MVYPHYLEFSSLAKIWTPRAPRDRAPGRVSTLSGGSGLSSYTCAVWQGPGRLRVPAAGGSPGRAAPSCEVEMGKLLTHLGVWARARARPRPQVVPLGSPPSGSGFRWPLPVACWVTLDKLLSLQMGVTPEPPRGVVGDFRMSLAPRGRLLATVPEPEPPGEDKAAPQGPPSSEALQRLLGGRYL